jgi:hypothetical protein
MDRALAAILVLLVLSGDKRPKYSCPKPEYEELLRIQSRLCKSDEKRSCRGWWLTCDRLKEHWKAHMECFQARRNLMDRCFCGGDVDHLEALRQDRNGINKCEQRLKEKECDVSDTYLDFYRLEPKYPCDVPQNE